MRKILRRKAERAFKEIDKKGENIAALRYVKSGFRGIYKLATMEQPIDETSALDDFWATSALDEFREAAIFSDMGLNKFAIIDCLYMCGRALAAQRTEPQRRVEANRYLREAEKVAEDIMSSFYFDLYYAALSAVSDSREKNGLAKRIDARLGKGQAKERVIRIFRENFNK